MPETVVVEAPAVAVDTPVAITVVMTDTPVAINVTVLATMGTLGTGGAHAMDLALDHLPLFIHRRPFTTMLSPVLIIAMILPVSTIPVFPSPEKHHSEQNEPRSPSSGAFAFVLGVCAPIVMQPDH
jgi:hypothetical protein